MTEVEAEKIFKYWQEYAEINDKLGQIFTSIPESFLPYPPDVLEEALNIVAKKYFDAGDHKTSRTIQENMATLIGYKNDNEAIEGIINSIALNKPELRKLYLANLKKSRNSWANFKK